MSKVMYNGKRLIPAPLMTVRPQKQRTRGGIKIGNIFEITVHGKIIPYKGSPYAYTPTGGTGWSSDHFWILGDFPPDETLATLPNDDTSVRLGAMFRKQEAIRTLFKDEGYAFEAQSDDGTPSLRFYPRVKGIDFPEGQWYDQCDYTITMEADIIYGAGGEIEEPYAQYISDYTETWELEEDEATQSFKLNHNVNAVGKTHYDTSLAKPAWRSAQDFVISRLNNNSPARPSDPNPNDPRADILAGFLGSVAGYAHYNRTRKETIDEPGGSYAVIESFILMPANTLATEDYTVSTHVTRENPIPQYHITGTITGLRSQHDAPQVGIPATQTERFQNAKQYWLNSIKPNLAARIASTVGEAVGPIVSQEYDYDPYHGIIKYSYEYVSAVGMCIPGAISESINVQDGGGEDVFASILVPGRRDGPILQDINTVTSKIREITIEAVMPPVTGVNCGSAQDILADKPDTNAFITALKPQGSQVFLSQNRESWNRKSGRYMRQVAYTWET